jgi:hypothetical protein
MSISAITPASGSTIAHGDSFAFTIDNTYTSLVIKVQTDTALVSAYDTSLGGAQPGFTVEVTTIGATDTFTVTRDAGWDISPQLIYVTENESGSLVTTTISYVLQSEASFPQGSVPYNPVNDQAALVNDHGSLSGLGDDDHPQYHNDARGDARYYVQATVDGLLLLKSNVGHTHLEADITDLDKYTQAQVDVLVGTKSDVGHTHPASDVVSGTFANARISQSSVLQHQAAIDHGTIAGLTDDDHTQYAQTLTGAGAPGVSTGNGLRVGATYADTTNDVGYILVDATTDANVWWTSAGGGGAGGLAGYGSWLYDTGTAGAGISNGDVRFNNATITSATQLFIAKTNNQSVNMGASLDDVEGWKLTFIKGDGTVLCVVTCGVPVDNSTYFTVPISAVVGSATITNNDELVVSAIPPAAFPSGTGGGGGPNYAFKYTQITDGTTNPATGEFRVRIGSSGTPSGITQFRLHPTDADSVDQTDVLSGLGVGNYVKIWKDSDPTEWYIYKITSASSVTASYNLLVSHIGDSGGTFDQSGDWNFHIFSGQNVQVVSSTHTYEVSFAANTNWHTYNLLTGHGDHNLSRDLGSTVVGTGIDARWGAFVAPVAGEVLDIQLSGYAPVGSINSIAFRMLKAATTTGSTAVTVTDLSAFDLPLTFNPSNAWGGLAGLYVTGSKTLSAGDMFGFICRRTAGGSPTTIGITVTYRMITGV